MAAPENHPNFQGGYYRPPDPQLDPEIERIFALQQRSKPWIVSFLDNIKEAFNPPKLPPLQVTTRPMTEAELEASDDPFLQRVSALGKADRGGWLQSLVANLKELFNPPKLPPLQVTSRPLSEEELSTLLELRKANLPWFKTFVANIKDLLFPEKLPPLEITSRPVQVRELFSRDEYAGKSRIISVGVHVGLVALAFLIGTNKQVQQLAKNTANVFVPDLSPYQPQMKAKPQAMGGGGGGGDRSPMPASKGKLPRPDLKQFTPPMAVVNNPAPRLVMEPTIIAPPDTQLPNVNLPNYGDPLAKLGPPSNGPGSGGGIGSGSGGGVGSGRGGGFGPGEGGGVGGGAYRIGGGVSAPVPIFKVEPEYSEEARKAKFQGTVLLAIVVDTDGKTRDIRVLRALGMGLDEKAIEAVAKWRFRPGYKDGKAVPVQANVEVNFRLL
jgi:periplasmic protein TonB